MLIISFSLSLGKTAARICCKGSFGGEKSYHRHQRTSFSLWYTLQEDSHRIGCNISHGSVYYNITIIGGLYMFSGSSFILSVFGFGLISRNLYLQIDKTKTCCFRKKICRRNYLKTECLLKLLKRGNARSWEWHRTEQQEWDNRQGGGSPDKPLMKFTDENLKIVKTQFALLKRNRSTKSYFGGEHLKTRY